jgi:hypothetical protein
MTHRENLIAALEGETPGRPALSIYDWLMDRAIATEDVAERLRRDEWRRLLDRGLLVCHHCEILEAVEHEVETTVEERAQDGDTLLVMRKSTPVGELRKITRRGWHIEDWIKEPCDYVVWTWIVEHTEIVPRYERFAAAEAAVGDHGVVVITGSGNWTHRTPAMKINVDIAGTQQFCTDVALEVPELFELYDALRKQFLIEQRLIAAGPGRYVKWLENLTIGMLGPERYRRLLMPVYREGVPMLEAGGKRVMVHYDGALGSIADQIAGAPFHMIESLTEPPEGDLAYDDGRRLWPDKAFWANLNIDLYGLPPAELAAAVRAKARRAGRRGVAFEISEDLPANWRSSIPIVLAALEEEDAD